MFLKVIIILFCCYLLTKYVSLGFINLVGEITNRKHHVGIISMVKKDIDCITNPDNTISEVLQYFIASIVLLALSPLILIFALIEYCRYVDLINKGMKDIVVTYLEKNFKDDLDEIFKD